ncbi:hypothetical protein GC163_13415 [bacterium]|nr:hypothetical protein [bacterium]
MQIERLPIDQLRSAPYNPRKTLKPGMPGYDKLLRSLTEFELVQPIVWNRTTGHIVGGHQRVQVLRDQGTTEVDCVVVELPLEREKALNVALNNARVGGDWDSAKLIDLVSELQSLPDFDATLTGFDTADLTHLLMAPAPLPPESADTDSDNEDQVQVTLEVPIDD